jgi:heat shock protein 5
MQVSDEDKGAVNWENTATTNGQNGITPDDNQQMIKDAEKLKERVQARNEIGSYAYPLRNSWQTKKSSAQRLDMVDVFKL